MRQPEMLEGGPSMQIPYWPLSLTVQWSMVIPELPSAQIAVSAKAQTLQIGVVFWASSL
jgi:hypothetical protein